MKLKIRYMKNLSKVIFLSLNTVFLIGCSDGRSFENEQAEKRQFVEIKSKVFKKGDLVSNNEVCMVNNVFMAKKQIEVLFDGKKYYGCCEICQERIPRDKDVRIAIDPLSKKSIDKASSLIAISGENGEVLYFENEKSYQAYFK